jgi:VCBS repeat-containing protein
MDLPGRDRRKGVLPLLNDSARRFRRLGALSIAACHFVAVSSTRFVFFLGGHPMSATTKIAGWLGRPRRPRLSRRWSPAQARRRFLRQPILEKLESREAPGSVLHLWMGSLLEAVTGGARPKLEPLTDRDELPGRTAGAGGQLANLALSRFDAAAWDAWQSELRRLAKQPPAPAAGQADTTAGEDVPPAVSTTVTGRAVELPLWFVFSTEDALPEEPPAELGPGLEAEDFRKYGSSRGSDDGGAGSGGSSEGGGGTAATRTASPGAAAGATDDAFDPGSGGSDSASTPAANQGSTPAAGVSPSYGPALPPAADSTDGGAADTVGADAGAAAPGSVPAGASDMPESPPATNAPTHLVPPVIPVLSGVYPLSQRGAGQLFVRGSLALRASPSTEVTLEFYARHGHEERLLDAVTVMRGKSETLDFTLVVDGKVPPGQSVFVKATGDFPGAGGISAPFDVHAPVDEDHDGVPNQIEDFAAGEGDGNRDGIADRLQSDVTSIPSAVTGQIVTLAGRGRPFEGAQAVRGPQGSRDARVPHGLFEFTLRGVEPGSITSFELVLPPSMATDTYYKVDPATGELTPFAFNGATGAIVQGNRVTLYVQDGGRGDADGIANGVIVDPGGPGPGVVLLTCSGPDGLEGWTVRQSGGTPSGKGSVTVISGDIVLMEGDSFHVVAERDIVIPASPQRLTIDFEESFDLTTRNFINDAFEIALVDPEDRLPVVSTFVNGRDAFFNFTEEEEPRTGQTTTLTGRNVDLDISQLPEGATYRLLLRLVNNDQDKLTQVAVACSYPPVAFNDAYSVDEDNTRTVTAPGLLANDTDSDSDVLSAIKVSDPAHGTVTVNANGSFTYTPHANFFGTDTFTYKATDGLFDSNVATVTITVNPVNDPPVAVADSYSVNEDTTLTVNATAGVLANDTDVEGNSLTAIKLTNPSNGTVTLNADGSLTYTPNPNFYGTDSFTYKANDGALDSGAATVTITVHAVNDPPTAINNSYGTDEDTPLSVSAPGVLANDSDPEGSILTAIKVSDPAHGTVTVNANGSFTYTPNPNFTGIDSFTYKANDGALDSNVATVTIDIGGVNDPPQAFNDSYSVNEDSVLTVNAPGVLANDTDVEGSPLSATLVTQPTHGTLTFNANGSFTYTPHLNFHGTDTFTYQVSDGQLESNVATVTITVNEINDAPVAGDFADVSENEGQSVALSVTFSDVDASDTHAATIDWGDGTVTTGSVNQETDTVTGSHVYADNGSYTITVTVSDRPGQSGSLSDSETGLATIANVAPTVTPASDRTAEVNQALDFVVATFTDPGFSYAPAGTAETFTATINWGDGTGTTTGQVTVTQGQAGTPTSGSVKGQHTYTYDGTFTVTVTVTDDDGGSRSATFTIEVEDKRGKFQVVDQPAKRIFRYGTGGQYTVDTPLAHFNSRPRGITSNLTATRTWVVDANHDVFIYDGLGNKIGSWKIQQQQQQPPQQQGSFQPEGIAVWGNDVWIVDAATNKVYLFQNKADENDGTYSPTSSFDLDAANRDPTGIDTDGTNFWVVNNRATAGEIFVYTMSGTLVGSWTLDPENGDPQGITIRPGGGSDLWVVDRHDARVYYYANGRNHTSGSHAATSSFALKPGGPGQGGNREPYGIADPNQPPDAVDDQATTTQGTPVDIYVLDNDTDPDMDLLTVVGITAPPMNGTAQIDPTGQYITYTPYSGFTGDSFQYQISDGNGGFDVATVNVTITGGGGGGGGNQPPWAEDDFEYEVIGTTTIYALANDYDPDGDPLSIIHVGAPSNGSAQIGANGQSIIYTPGANFTGDSFQYTISDGQGNSATATVWLYAPPSGPGGGGGFGGGGFGGSFPPSGQPDVRTDVTAFDLAQAMTVDTSILMGAEFVTAPPSGRPVAVASANLTWFPLHGYDYAVLTSGDAALINDPGVFATNALGGMPVRGDSDYDVTILRVDFYVYPGLDCLSFDLQFLSEEWPIYVGSPFNDAFLVELDSTNWATMASQIVAPLNFAFDPNGHPISINTTGFFDMTPSNGFGTAYDSGVTLGGDTNGAGTELLRASTPITPGFHSLYFSIFDQGDQILDSAVFLDNLIVDKAGPAGCVRGVTRVIDIVAEAPGTRFPVGTQVLVTGELLTNADVASITVNGTSVEAIDAGKHFFTTVEIKPGENVLEFVGVDTQGSAASTTLVLEGYEPTDGIDFSSLSDVTASILGRYHVTSFHDQRDVLFAELKIENSGQYLIDAPLLVGIDHLSAPSVSVYEPDGISEDGIP